jgi:potassium channel subfamily K, other eukaryote
MNEMATGMENSDERAVRAASAEPPSPDADKITFQDAADETNAANGDVERLESNELDIWEAEKAGEAYFVPIRIWCASVLFPLCAGCFGPMASAFGICALTGSWKVQNLTKAADNMLVGTDITIPAW